MTTAVASVVLALVVLLNLVATVMLARSDFETPLQKALQLVFAWVVPGIGSIIVIAVLRSARSDHKPRLRPAPQVTHGSLEAVLSRRALVVTMVATVRAVVVPGTRAMAGVVDIDQAASAGDSQQSAPAIAGRVFDGPRSESMIWINQLRWSAMQSRVDQLHR